VIELRSVTEEYKKLYAWVQHVRLQSHKDDNWIHDDDVSDAFGQDAESYTTYFNGYHIDLRKLKRIATVVTIIKVFENQGDYKAGIRPLSAGVSVCDVQDQWSRKYGREQAIKRALNRMKMEFVKDDDYFIDHS